MAYSRENPSPRYVDLLAQYKDLHENGDPINHVPAETIFDGKSLLPQVMTIKNVIEKNSIKSLLDYGCGKAMEYGQFTAEAPDGTPIQGLDKFWGITDITLYDPAVEAYSALPEGRFEAVISTDVLEHCPEEDLEWIVSEIFDYSKVCVYCTVALYPAGKNLPNGGNVHVTLKDAGWWLNFFETLSKKFDHRKYYLITMRSPSDMMIITG